MATASMRRALNFRHVSLSIVMTLQQYSDISCLKSKIEFFLPSCHSRKFALSSAYTKSTSQNSAKEYILTYSWFSRTLKLNGKFPLHISINPKADGSEASFMGMNFKLSRNSSFNPCSMGMCIIFEQKNLYD